MSSIFEFSISKLGYTEIFMKICGKKISTHFLGYYSLVKTKDEDEKIWENEFDI